MLSNKNLNKNKTFPLIKNQIPNNNSQIINCYINLTQNLNMNNHNCSLVTQIPLTKNSTNLTPEKSNLDRFNKTALLNTVINMNYLLQMQANYQHYSQLISNVNNTNLNQNEKKLKEKPNMMGKKRSRKSKNDEIKINIKKTDKNIKNIIKEKNGTFDKNKIEGDISKIDHSTDNEINETENEQNPPMKQQIKINIEKKNENTKNNSNNSINKKKLNRKKKRNQYKELLQDTILEHLDCPKNDISIIINNSEYDETNNEQKNKNVHKNENTKKNINFKNDHKSLNLKKSNSIKRKTSNFNNRRYNRHFTQKKKSKSNIIKYQATQCIFHGDNYQKTNSAIDFMKYNYNFIEEKKQPKKIENAERQTVQVDSSKIIYSNNYENNKYNLSDIKPIWLKSEFQGKDSELVNFTNLVKNKLKNERDEINEEENLERMIKNPECLNKN